MTDLWLGDEKIRYSLVYCGARGNLLCVLFVLLRFNQ